MRKEYDYKEEKKKLFVFFFLMILFAVATFLGGIMVLYRNYNTLFSVIPAVLTLIFSFFCKRSRKRIQRHERQKDRE